MRKIVSSFENFSFFCIEKLVFLLIRSAKVGIIYYTPNIFTEKLKILTAIVVSIGIIRLVFMLRSNLNYLVSLEISVFV